MARSASAMAELSRSAFTLICCGRLRYGYGLRTLREICCWHPALVLPWRFGLGVAGLLAGCGTDYLAPPTACDDWCLASQRAQCVDDYPEKCVSECERGAGAHLRKTCQSEWQDRLACYQAAPDTDFLCRGGRSERGAGVCEVPDALWLRCTGANACAYHCLFQASLCDAASTACDYCSSWPPACEDETTSYLECLLRDPGEALCNSLLMISEVVCTAEGQAMLDCVERSTPRSFGSQLIQSAPHRSK